MFLQRWSLKKMWVFLWKSVHTFSFTSKKILCFSEKDLHSKHHKHFQIMLWGVVSDAFKCNSRLLCFLEKKIGRFWHYNNALRKRRKSLLIPFLNDPISIFITFLILLLVTLSRSWINNWFENQVIRIFLSS